MDLRVKPEGREAGCTLFNSPSLTATNLSSYKNQWLDGVPGRCVARAL